MTLVDLVWGEITGRNIKEKRDLAKRVNPDLPDIFADAIQELDDDQGGFFKLYEFLLLAERFGKDLGLGINESCLVGRFVDNNPALIKKRLRKIKIKKVVVDLLGIRSVRFEPESPRQSEVMYSDKERVAEYIRGLFEFDFERYDSVVLATLKDPYFDVFAKRKLKIPDLRPPGDKTSHNMTCGVYFKLSGGRRINEGQ